MLITGNFEAHALKLVSPDITLQQRQTLVTEMRDSIEIVHTSEYGNFLKHLFPAFYKLLSEGKPQFTEVRAARSAAAAAALPLSPSSTPSRRGAGPGAEDPQHAAGGAQPAAE